MNWMRRLMRRWIEFSKGVYALKENGVDMITVSDSPLARSRADAALLAVYAKRLTDISVMPHVAMRDRDPDPVFAQKYWVHMQMVFAIFL